jgi:penicillin-binding protein 1C
MKIGKSHAKVPARVICGFVCTTFSIIAVAAGLAWASIPLRSFDDVRKEHKPSDIWIVDRNGVPLESVRRSKTNRSLAWVPWPEVSPAFQDLLVLVEDRRFYSHPGIDPLAIAHATWQRVAGSSHRGASTLTMQLAMLLRDETLGSRRNIRQKLYQAAAALKINSLWTKENVLEAYINLVPFRGELVGLRAASLGYFGKNPAGLMREEAALLIALLRSPNAPVERVAARACTILALSDCEPIQILAQQKLLKPYKLARARELIPVVSNKFQIDSPDTTVIQTSLDFRIQLLAMNALREQ